MLKLFILSLYIQLLCIMHNPSCQLRSQSVDSIYTNWNKSTLASLERQLYFPKDTVKKEYYENRILSFKALLGINVSNVIDTNSIRYEFLKECWPFKKASDFYVIEANSSGQSLLFRNFIIYSSSTGTNVEIYKKSQKWKKIGFFKLNDLPIRTNLKSYLVKKGFNYEDIVITRFKNNKVVESEYFLFGTLDPKSGVQNILNNDKKENFIPN